MMCNFPSLKIIEIDTNDKEWLEVEHERNIESSDESVSSSSDFVAA